MKRMLMSLVALLLFVPFAHAGSPQDQGAALSGKFFHTAIFGSSSTVAANVTVNAIPAPGSATSGALTTNYVNCFSKFTVQMSSMSSFEVWDATSTTANGGPTAPALQVLGSAVGTAGQANTIVLTEPHLEPLCLTNVLGTLIQIKSLSTPTGWSTGNAFSYEGWTSAGPGSNMN